MHILLLGATGGVGSSFLQQALEKGDSITALVRNPGKVTRSHPNLKVVQGDVFDAGSLLQVPGGYDAVVSCLNTSKGVKESDELQRMMQNVVTAMQHHEVRRIVYCASAGIDGEIPGEKGREVMHFLRYPLHDHLMAVNIIKAANLDYTIARPGGLLNNELTGRYKEAGSGVPEGALMISRADTAHFMLKALHDDAYIGQSVGLSN